MLIVSELHGTHEAGEGQSKRENEKSVRMHSRNNKILPLCESRSLRITSYPVIEITKSDGQNYHRGLVFDNSKSQFIHFVEDGSSFGHEERRRLELGFDRAKNIDERNLS